MAGIHRRQFLQAGAVTAAALACPAPLTGMELELGGKNLHQIRTYHLRTRSHYLCSLCPWLDGGFAFSDEGGEIQKCEGNPDHIATRGKFCAKGLASFLSAADPDRIMAPLKRTGSRGSGQWQEISWNEAIALVAAKVTAALPEPDTICVNEGGYKDEGTVRFLDTLGSRSLIRSCTPGLGGISKQHALKETLGVPFALPDVERTKYVLNFGANILETALPLAQRLTDGIVNNRLKLVTFDVRMSNTAGRSHEWIPVFPGSDGVVALAMANVILQKGLADTVFIETFTNTSVKALTEALKAYTPEMAEKASGVPAKTIKRIAIEFAKSKPATVFSMNGITWHQNGGAGEMACLLLAAITGNIDNEGGCCLPKPFDVAQPQPAPKANTALQYNHTFPFQILAGKRRVRVLFNHLSNPAYSSPAASVWRQVLKDENLVPFIVDFSPFMSETAELADLILPDVVGVERHDLASSPSSLLPWVSISTPTVKPRGQAQDVRETLKKIIEAVDGDGKRGMKGYWAFANAKQWVEQAANATPGLEKNYKKLVSRGFWPEYGKLDPANRQIVTKEGEPVEPVYGSYRKSGFPTPSGKVQVTVPAWTPNPRHAALKGDEFVLTTFKVAYHVLSMTSNLKYLSEIWHANPLWLNKDVGVAMGIDDGDLVRVQSPVGYLVTRAFLTNGIHPKAVGISTSVGRAAYGRVAKADPDRGVPFAHETQRDEDIEDNVWWRDGGTNPNDIIPIAIDAASGEQAWNDTVVTIAKAEFGDSYGDIKTDNAKHVEIFNKMAG